MNLDLTQLQKQLQALENDRDIQRATTEIASLEKEISRLEAKRDEWAEKKRQREAVIVTERHELERKIEEAKRAQNEVK